MTNSAISTAIKSAVNGAQIELLSAETDFVWENKVRTDKIAGTRYSAFIKSLDREKITVITTETTPAIEPKVLAQANISDKPIYVSFEGLEVNSYVKDRNYICTFTAKKAMIKTI